MSDRIATQLQMINDFRIQSDVAAPDDWAHRTYEGMVLDLGQPFTRKSLPTWFRRMKQGMCYRNAFHCVTRDQYYNDRFRYVEGYAAGIMVTDHAFVLDTEDGMIFDPTWERDELHTDYYGIVFPTEFAVGHMISSGYYGLLCNDWMNDNLLLRDGRKMWASFETETMVA